LQSLYYDRESKQFNNEDRDVERGSLNLDHDINMFIETELIPLLTGREEHSEYGIQNLKTILYYAVAHDTYFRKLNEISLVSKDKKSFSDFKLSKKLVDKYILKPYENPNIPRNITLGELKSGRYKIENGNITKNIIKDMKKTLSTMLTSLDKNEAYKLVDYKSCVTTMTMLKQYINNGGLLEDLDINDEDFIDYATNVEKLRARVQRIVKKEYEVDNRSEFTKETNKRYKMPDFKEEYVNPQKSMNRFIANNLIAQNLNNLHYMYYDRHLNIEIDDSNLSEEDFIARDVRASKIVKNNEKLIKKSSSYNSNIPTKVTKDDDSILEDLCYLATELVKQGGNITSKKVKEFLEDANTKLAIRSAQKNQVKKEEMSNFVDNSIENFDKDKATSFIGNAGIVALAASFGVAVCYGLDIPEFAPQYSLVMGAVSGITATIASNLSLSKKAKVKELYSLGVPKETISSLLLNGRDLNDSIDLCREKARIINVDNIETNNNVENKENNTSTKRRRRRQNRDDNLDR